jgi:hypothetical protein
MTVNKQFAHDGGDLDASMDELVEVLAQLLDEPAGTQNQDASPAIADLHSGDDRGIHVIESEPEK